MAAEGDYREGDGVVAGEDGEIVGGLADDCGDLADVAGGFFYADDVFDLREASRAWPARR